MRIQGIAASFNSLFVLFMLATFICSLLVVGQKQDLEDIPPFFINNFTDRGQRNHTSNQDSTLGVSVHFQNDGAALYLLTHASSPPTLDTVKRWISKVAKHDEFNQSAGRIITSSHYLRSFPCIYDLIYMHFDTEVEVTNCQILLLSTTISSDKFLVSFIG